MNYITNESPRGDWMAICVSSETVHLLQPFMEHNIYAHEHIPEVRVEVLFVCIEKHMKMVGSVMLFHLDE